MDEPRIIVYGQGDRSALGFKTAQDLVQYIETGIKDQRYRYRYTQGKDVDIIVLSRDGRAYGHFHALRREHPDALDLRDYPRTKYVYIIGNRALYTHPVPLFPLGIRVGQFGSPISVSQFEEINRSAGGIREFQ